MFQPQIKLLLSEEIYYWPARLTSPNTFAFISLPATVWTLINHWGWSSALWGSAQSARAPIVIATAWGTWSQSCSLCFGKELLHRFTWMAAVWPSFSYLFQLCIPMFPIREHRGTSYEQYYPWHLSICHKEKPFCCLKLVSSCQHSTSVPSQTLWRLACCPLSI